MLDKAFEKFMKCPVEDVATRELMYNLGLDFERKRMFNKALAVYQHISKAGPFKDISDRITALKQISTSFSLPRNTGQNGGLSLQSTQTKPTLGRYEILQELGRGAMGVVYLGNDPSINRHVAIKTLNYADIEPDQLDEVKTRFFREAEAAGNLSHPNIVTIYDAGEDHDMAYIAMELLQGTELTAHCRKENALPIQRILPIITAVAEALGYAHRQGVVHRDIKPANIILRQADQVKVTDFGIARVISSSKTQTGIIFGTPSYMSPEQAAGKKVDGRSDIFSLGIVFYELLCMTKPFKGDSIAGLMAAISNSDYTPIADIMPETPPCCMDIVDKLLAKFLTKRFQSADRVVEAIQDCQAQLQP
jgi:serine/threonine-protein kinase